MTIFGWLRISGIRWVRISGTHKGLNGFNTVLLTARLSAMFRHSTWTQNPKDAKALEKFQYWFASAFLDLETKQRLESRFGAQNPARRPVFHRCKP
jgi:hypothetical protein